jgi:hypothetical protein
MPLPKYQQVFLVVNVMSSNDENEQSLFWNQYSDIITIALVLLYCVPASIIGSKFTTELALGHFEILSTLPGNNIK